MTGEVAWWRLVAGREVRVRARDKTFRWGTAALVVLVLGGLLAVSFLGGRPPSYQVAVVEDGGVQLAAAAQEQLRAQSRQDEATVEVRRTDDHDAARAAVTAEEVDAALLPTDDGYQLVGRDGVPADLASAASAALSLSVLQAAAERAGTSLEALTAGSRLTEGTTIASRVPADVAAGLAFLLALLFLLPAIVFGVAIAQSVVVEKENRIVEILAAAMPVRSLLWGKVVGNSLLAFGQVIAVAVAAVVGLALVGDLDALPAVGPAGLWFLAFFVVGFLALASLWSVVGSVATRQEDLQATSMPMQALLFVPYFVASLGNERAIEIASFVPIASSMTMPARTLRGDVPAWQPVLSLVLAGLAAALLVRLGARWYERSLLRTSRRTTYRELLRGAGVG
jgi:ABC-2 type transport system permease protein